MNFLQNKKITVMGLGLHGGGVETVKFLVKRGVKLLITDLKSRKELVSSIKKLKGLPVKYVFGKHRVGDFKNVDMIIKNPAVPEESKYLKIAKKNKIPIESDISIFLKEIGFNRKTCCEPAESIIGVTGTKGKSTVTSLIGEILKKKYPKTIIAGNIRVSPLKMLSKKISKNVPIVLELSSWQLAGIRHLKWSPQIAVFTNIMPDHLNRYKSMKDYIKDKKIIFKYQKKGDVLVANKDNQKLRQIIKKAKPKSQIIWFSKKDLKKYKLKNIKLRGEHNLENIAAAAAMAAAAAIPQKFIKKTIENFSGLDSRLQLVKESRGVKYYNDTTATTPEATIAALGSFPKHKKKIILIAGGADKNLNFRQFAKEIKKSVKKLILLKGIASPKIRCKVKDVRYKGKITRANSMRGAVKEAKKDAKEGDLVLLSPGCASFGLFKHEFDRGEEFIKEVRKL